MNEDWRMTHGCVIGQKETPVYCTANDQRGLKHVLTCYLDAVESCILYKSVVKSVVSK